MIIKFSKRLVLAVLITALVVALVAGLLVYFLVLRPQSLGQSAVVTNGIECAQIGMNIIQKGGSVADAVIAVMFCEGVACPQSTGLGGGFVMTIYTKKTGLVETLIARERAPGAAHRDMYEKLPENASQRGGLSVAVPGELAGYATLYEKYGTLPWAELVEPSIKLCKEGHVVSAYLYKIIQQSYDSLKAEDSLREIYFDPETNEPYLVGQFIKRPMLAKTLEVIAKEGPRALYNGSLTDAFVDDIKGFGGIITKEDMANYKPIWSKPNEVDFPQGYKLYTTPAPSSGPLLSFIMNILNGYPTIDYSSLSFHRLIESFKYAYAKRTDLGDPDFVKDIGPLLANLTSIDYANHIREQINDDLTVNDYKHYGASFTITEDHGTAHVSIVGPNGDAVSITGTINYLFGAMRRSRQTGIILNDEMDDFSIPGRNNVYGVPPSPANFIEPGKIPMSSMCPAILINSKGEVEMALGAAGGTKITTSVAYVIMRQIFFGETLPEAITAKRVHHQLIPMRVDHEESFNSSIINSLVQRGHTCNEIPLTSGFAAVTGISMMGDNIHAVYDPRRGGNMMVST